MKKIFWAIGIILFAVIFFIIHSGGWANFKLNINHFYKSITVENNPSLSTYDKDFTNLENSKIEPRISLKELKSGGPGKDGIPSIDNLKFNSTENTEFSDDELIVGVYLNDEARAYPYGILNWHEIVNDKIGDTPISVTLCPLCDTNPVFVRKVNGEETTFGVSGKLYQSCLVMYDRKTDSLWSQPWGLAIAGEKTNQELEKIVSVKTTLGKWKTKYPNTKILSTNTGYNRNYFHHPYENYSNNDNLNYPVRNQDKLKINPKDIISYIWKADNKTPKDKFSGNFKQIIHKEIKEKGEEIFFFDDMEIKAIWDKDLETVRFFNGENEIGASTAFGFVYPAFFE